MLVETQTGFIQLCSWLWLEMTWNPLKWISCTSCSVILNEYKNNHPSLFSLSASLRFSLPPGSPSAWQHSQRDTSITREEEKTPSPFTHNSLALPLKRSVCFPLSAVWLTRVSESSLGHFLEGRCWRSEFHATIQHVLHLAIFYVKLHSEKSIFSPWNIKMSHWNQIWLSNIKPISALLSGLIVNITNLWGSLYSLWRTMISFGTALVWPIEVILAKLTLALIGQFLVMHCLHFVFFDFPSISHTHKEM